MTRNVAFVLFDDAEELDWAGPWEVFTMLSQVVPDSVKCYIVSERGGIVKSAKGLRVEADHSFTTAPKADIAVVPGGLGTRREEHNSAMLDYMRATASGAEVTASVCTGAFVLARAGLLDGKRATTYWSEMPRLGAIEGIEPVQQRWVDEGNVITAAGVSAGIDMALHLVGRFWSPDIARAVQKYMQYYPAPPYQDAALPEWSVPAAR